MGSSAYRFSVHTLGSLQEITPIMITAQAGLNIENGPVFSVDTFDVDGDDQIKIFMVAHHLCIDMVSWRIIGQDLGQFFETGSLAADTPLPFQSWRTVQSNHNSADVSHRLLPFEETPTDPGYWGVQGPFTYGNTDTEAFSLDEDVTKLALTDSHKAFRSEPVDLFLAAIAHSFAANFGDRQAPTLHFESHGREAPEGTGVDLSGTVGWFTSICPLVIPTPAGDALDTVRRTKDIRRSIPENGRPYFTRKWLGGMGGGSSAPMEVLFNYLGGGQHQEKSEESLLNPVELHVSDDHEFSRATADVGPETRRLALFEISAIVIDNQLHFSFIYDSGLSRADEVRRWIGDCKTTLEEMARRLTQCSAEPTLSDYPLLPLTYDGLRRLTEVALPRAGVADILSHVEDVYPCGPVQEGMLISQLREPSAYIFHAIYKVKRSDNAGPVDAARIARAWQTVVDRHGALRTVFIESVHRGSIFDQVVLKEVDCGAVLFDCHEDEAMERLAQISFRQATPSQPKQPQLPHRLAVCTTQTGEIIVKLEVNHIAIDGGSLSIVLEELAAAYAGTIEDAPGPLYSDYIQYIRSRPAQADVKYWMQYLGGLRPCYFPKLNRDAGSAETRSLRAKVLQFDRYAELRQLSERIQVTIANIMHVAWAFVLRKYTGADDVCFGYLTAGRDAPVEDIRQTVGCFINMLCCRIQLCQTQTLEEVFREAQDQHLQGLPYQSCSLARVQHELGLAGRTLYNTSISIQNHSDTVEMLGGEGPDAISFEMEQGHDPSEVSSVALESKTTGTGCSFSSANAKIRNSTSSR